MGQAPNPATLFTDSDLEVEDRLAAVPIFWPFATPGTELPPPGARCSRCLSTNFWHERSGRIWGLRCIVCVPPARPDDRIVVVDTAVVEMVD